MSDFQKDMSEKGEARLSSSEESEVALLEELIQGNVDRSKVVVEQMADIKLAVKGVRDNNI